MGVSNSHHTKTARTFRIPGVVGTASEDTKTKTTGDPGSIRLAFGKTLKGCIAKRLVDGFRCA